MAVINHIACIDCFCLKIQCQMRNVICQNDNLVDFCQFTNNLLFDNSVSNGKCHVPIGEGMTDHIS